MPRRKPPKDRQDHDGGSPINRRSALARISTVVAAAVRSAPTTIADPLAAQEPRSTTRRNHLRKIGTEEAFTIPEVTEAIRELVRRGGPNLDLKLLSLIYGSPRDTSSSTPPPAANRDALARTLLPRLLDLDTGRLADMNANGVDMHLPSPGMPGVQMFEPDVAVALARLSNDRLSEAVRRHPARFAGLASFAPQDPPAAAKEMERAINAPCTGTAGVQISSPPLLCAQA